jgi:hypothetical protein
MSTHRYRAVSLPTNDTYLSGIVEPGIVIGQYGARPFLDIFLADDAQLSVLDEVMARFGYTFFGTAPAAGDVPPVEIMVEELTGLITAPPVAPAGSARLYFDLTAGMIRLSKAAGAYLPIEALPDASQSPLIPVSASNAQTTRALPTLMEGGAYFLNRRMNPAMNLFARLTASGVGGTVRYALYQVPGGIATGAAALLATGTHVSTGGAQNVSIPLGGISISPGVLYVLQGRTTSAITTARVYTSPTLDLFNTNTIAGQFPAAFETLIDATVAPPATFDPLVDAVVSTLNVVPIIRIG